MISLPTTVLKISVIFAISILPEFNGFCGEEPTYRFINISEFERARVIRSANEFLAQEPITVTASFSPRSAGGRHDYFSEGDYWWQNPEDPQGPYIRRDGETNPNNFDEHRKAMVRFDIQVAALTTAYKITGDEKYARQAVKHLHAWFVEPETRMNSHLNYAQAIHSRVTGRGVGIIDTIHLIEVARSALILQNSKSLSQDDFQTIRRWFADYLLWLTTHPYGIEERDSKNNHATCWVMQVAAFAQMTGNDSLMQDCRWRFKTILLPNQMAADGSYPEELRRTKPYSYSLFNLDAMATICQILSTPEDNLWTFQLPDGRGMKKALEFMVPFITDKSKWHFPPDVQYFENFPVRQTALLFGGLAYHEPKYIEFWKSLEANPTEREVLRNLPIRQPVLWVDD